MNTELKNKLVDKIYEDWKDTPQEDICIALIEWIIKSDYKKLTHLTYARLQNIVKCANEDFMIGFKYLCEDETKLFNSNLEYIGVDDIPYPLEVNEGDEYLIHPETGEVIRDISNVYPYFTLTDTAKAISVYS